MALQDVENGEGLAVIDPHGEFVEEILESIPRHRMKDVVYFNPADMEHPVSFNIMDVQDPRYKHLIASGLIGIFTKIWANVWSARMEYILANSILALLDTPGTTLLGIPRMLVDRDYRQKIINNLQDPVVKSFWINEYEEWESRYRNEAIAPVQNKVGQFLNVSFVRNIVGQAKNTIDIEGIMNTGKILLVNVSKGRIGEDNSAILGAMIITKIQLSAMERVRIPESDRRDFYLYVDEFQNFATDSFRNILSEARKYRLNLIMAHQYIGQLVTDKNTAVRDAVFGNVGTEISFRVGAEDAEFLEKEFTPEFLQDDFVRLANRDTYIKLMIGGITSRPFSAKTITIAPIPKDDKKRIELINLTREKYARSKQAVEDEINRWAANLDVSSKGAVPVQWQNNQKQPQGHKQQDGTMLYDAVCSNCGKKTKVIFEPTSGKPVYCKTCFKNKKPDKSPAGHSDGPATILPKADLGGDEKDSALASLGIEFGSSKIIKNPEQNKPQHQVQQKSQQIQSQVKPQVKPQVVEPVKIENVEFKNTHHQKDTQRQNQPYQNQPQKREINLAELRKALAESLEKEEKEKQEKTEINKVESLPLVVTAPEENKLELQESKPLEKLAPVIPAPASQKPADVGGNAGIQSAGTDKVRLDPKEELRKRIAQEKMADEMQKKMGIDFSNEPVKGEIKPGQTIKF
jgi:CxxC-x17-CxxC domain-containing protein